MERYQAFAEALITVCFALLLMTGSNAAPPEKIVTSIRIENTGSIVKVYITSSQTLAWKMVRKDGGASPAIKLLISPVDPDPEAPKEIPINAGLIKKVQFTHLNDKDKSLMVAVEVVSIPQYTLQERPDKKGLTLVMNREVMLGKKVSKPPAEAPKKTGTKLENSFSVFFSATKGSSLKQKDSPLVVKTEQQHAIETGRELKKNLSVLMDASGQPSKKRRGPEAAQAGKEMLNTEFKDAELVVILKFIAEKMALNLITSPHVKGSKSVVISDMTPEEALPLILKGTGYWYRIEKQILFVGPPALLGSFSPEATVDGKENVTRVIVLKKLRIEPLVPALIKKYPGATFEPHSSLNSIVITAPEPLMDKIEKEINGYEKDAPEPAPAKDKNREDSNR
jgi:hypothetical protein